MLKLLWPMALVIFSNVMYQICAKTIPQEMNPFASLIITYVTGAVVSLILYFVLEKDANIFREFQKTSWAPVIFGLTIVGLEVGWVFAYKSGWPISTAQVVQSAFLAVILIFVGALLFKEVITWNKIVGVVICLTGLVFINYK